MSQSAPKCSHVSDVYHFGYPSEDKIRTPSLFQEQIKRFGARCKDANDEIKCIKECIPECRKEAAEANAKVLSLKKQIAELERMVGAESKKKKPNLKQIAEWRDDIASHKASMEDAAKDSAEWAKSGAACEKLKGEWEKELESLRKILETLLREWKKGSPWGCGAPTEDKPPKPCGNTSNYVGGEWVPCYLHR